METIAELCASSVAFSYRSIDRLILNAALVERIARRWLSMVPKTG